MLRLHAMALAGLLLFACGDIQLPDDTDTDGVGTGITIDSVTPPGGPITGATAVTVAGSGFAAGETRILLGGQEAVDVEVLNADTLVFRAPPATEPGPVGITIFNANGFGAQSDAYTYQPVLVVNSLSPIFGHANGGDTVTVTGEGFQDTDPGPLVATFAGNKIEVEVINDTTLTFTAPPGEEWTASALSIRTRNGEAETSEPYTYMLPGLLGVSNQDGALFHIDPASGVSTRIRVSEKIAGSSSLAMTKDGRLYASHRGHLGNTSTHLARVFIHDDAREEVFGPELNSRFGGMDASDDGKLLLVSRNLAEGMLTLDLDTEQVVATTPLPLQVQNNCRGCAIARDGTGRIFGAFAGSTGELLQVQNNVFEVATLLQSAAIDNIRALTFAGPTLLGVRRGGGGGAGFAPGGSNAVSTLIRINIETGETTDVAALPGRIDGLTTIPLAPAN